VRSGGSPPNQLGWLAALGPSCRHSLVPATTPGGARRLRGRGPVRWISACSSARLVQFRRSRDGLWYPCTVTGTRRIVHAAHVRQPCGSRTGRTHERRPGGPQGCAIPRWHDRLCGPPPLSVPCRAVSRLCRPAAGPPRWRGRLASGVEALPVAKITTADTIFTKGQGGQKGYVLGVAAEGPGLPRGAAAVGPAWRPRVHTCYPGAVDPDTVLPRFPECSPSVLVVQREFGVTMVLARFGW
jgi:hypothetical protein